MSYTDTEHPKTKAESLKMIEPLQAELSAVEAELATIKERLAEVPKLERRLQELEGSFFDRRGALQRLKGQISFLQFPQYIEPGYESGAYRPSRGIIVAVDDQWITLKNGDLRRYKRSTGRRERCRSYYDMIDIAHALKTWDEFHAAQ